MNNDNNEDGRSEGCRIVPTQHGDIWKKYRFKEIMTIIDYDKDVIKMMSWRCHEDRRSEGWRIVPTQHDDIGNMI